MNPDKIGQLISKLRKKKCLTQEQLGQKLGVSSKAVSKWECGLTTPDISIVNELAEILGITTTELLNGHETLNKKRVKNVITDLILAVIKNKVLLTIIIIFSIIFLMLLLFFVNNYNKFEIISFEINKNNIDKENIFANGFIYITPNRDYISLNTLLFMPEDDARIKDLTITIENDETIIFFYQNEETLDDDGNVKSFYPMDFLNTFSHVTTSGKTATRFKPSDLKLVLKYTPENEAEPITKTYDLNSQIDSASVKFLNY